MPLFYTRSSDGLPRGWIRMMKQSISTCCPVFNTNRMIQDYVEKCYRPSAKRHNILLGDGLKNAVELAQWRKRLAQGWQQIKVEAVESNGADPMQVGKELDVKARVNLGGFISTSTRSANFGKIGSTPDVDRGNPVLGSGGPRTMQWAVKVLF